MKIRVCYRCPTINQGPTEARLNIVKLVDPPVTITNNSNSNNTDLLPPPDTVGEPALLELCPPLPLMLILPSLLIAGIQINFDFFFCGFNLTWNFWCFIGIYGSFKKPTNAQGGGQPRVNLPPVNHSVSKDGLHPNNHNGPNAHSRSQGMIFNHGGAFIAHLDEFGQFVWVIVWFSSAYLTLLVTGVSGEPVVGGTANPESFNRNSGPIPKAPTSQSTAMSSKNNETPNTAKGRSFWLFYFLCVHWVLKLN